MAYNWNDDPSIFKAASTAASKVASPSPLKYDPLTTGYDKGFTGQNGPPAAQPQQPRLAEPAGFAAKAQAYNNSPEMLAREAANRQRLQAQQAEAARQEALKGAAGRSVDRLQQLLAKQGGNPYADGNAGLMRMKENSYADTQGAYANTLKAIQQQMARNGIAADAGVMQQVMGQAALDASAANSRNFATLNAQNYDKQVGWDQSARDWQSRITDALNRTDYQGALDLERQASEFYQNARQAPMDQENLVSARIRNYYAPEQAQAGLDLNRQQIIAAQIDNQFRPRQLEQDLQYGGYRNQDAALGVNERQATQETTIALKNALNRMGIADARQQEELINILAPVLQNPLYRNSMQAGAVFGAQAGAAQAANNYGREVLRPATDFFEGAGKIAQPVIRAFMGR